MKAIIKYKSESGQEFDSDEEAIKADELFAMHNALSNLLPQAIDKSCEFANGGGYIQHSQTDIDAFIMALGDVIIFEFGENSNTVEAWNKGGPRGIVGRYLDDSGSNAYRLYSRLISIDPENREWGQPYYGLNPGKGTPKEWDKTERRGLFEKR